MPDEVALDADDLELVVVDLRDDAGAPLVADQSRLLEQIDRLVRLSRVWPPLFAPCTVRWSSGRTGIAPVCALARQVSSLGIERVREAEGFGGRPLFLEIREASHRFLQRRSVSDRHPP